MKVYKALFYMVLSLSLTVFARQVEDVNTSYKIVAIEDPNIDPNIRIVAVVAEDTTLILALQNAVEYPEAGSANLVVFYPDPVQELSVKKPKVEYVYEKLKDFWEWLTGSTVVTEILEKELPWLIPAVDLIFDVAEAVFKVKEVVGLIGKGLPALGLLGPGAAAVLAVGIAAYSLVSLASVIGHHYYPDKIPSIPDLIEEKLDDMKDFILDKIKP